MTLPLLKTFTMNNLKQRLRHLFKRKGQTPLSFEASLKAEWCFYVNTIRAGMVILDCGAHIGELTLLFSKFTGLTGQVHAFEPTPETFSRLQSLCKLATRFDNITLNQLAIAEISGTVTFNAYNQTYSAWNSIYARPLDAYGLEVPNPEMISVPTTTITEYCQEHHLDHIHLLKIDTEGAELLALQGARSYFENKKIDYCVFEVGQTTLEAGFKPADFEAFFLNYGYRLFNVASNRKVFDYDPKKNSLNYGVVVAARPGIKPTRDNHDYV